MGPELELSQKQILSARMIQSVEILQMSASELESYIERLAAENPLIELPGLSCGCPELSRAQIESIRRERWLEGTDRQNRSYYKSDGAADVNESSWWDAAQNEETLEEHLHSQLLSGDYSKREREILNYIILSLDSSGYLDQDTAQIAARFNVSADLAETLLSDIQELDPAGVGARSLKECLLIQTRRLSPHCETVTAVIENHLGDLAGNHIAKIAKALGISAESVSEACEIIKSLNPRPGGCFSDRSRICYVRPDVLVSRGTDGFEIIMKSGGKSLFSVNEYYCSLPEAESDPETKKYLKEKSAQVKWLSDTIRERESTLLKIVRAVVCLQQDFFMYGPSFIKPMKLSDVASQVGLHESTVSRAMREKYLQCSWGVFRLNCFLASRAASSESGEEKTPGQVKAMLRGLIDGEDKRRPYSDQKLCEELSKLGVPLARRTVNKYRTEMGIPDKSGRKAVF